MVYIGLWWLINPNKYIFHARKLTMGITRGHKQRVAPSHPRAQKFLLLFFTMIVQNNKKILTEIF